MEGIRQVDMVEVEKIMEIQASSEESGEELSDAIAMNKGIDDGNTVEVVKEEGTKEAIRLGKALMEKETDRFLQINRGDVEDIGGTEAFLQIFVRFYERLFADPYMFSLFHDRDARPPEEHGKLLGGFILAHFTSDNTYYNMRASGKGHGMIGSHHQAMDSKHRGANAGRQFLRSQMYCWLGHMELAMGDVGVTAVDFKAKLLTYLKRFMSKYEYFMVEYD